MMKSLVTNAQAVLHALFKDVRGAYPSESTLDLDRKSLLTLIKNRGLSSLMIDLPHLDDLLTRGLECGRLEPSGALSRCVSKTVRVPRLFSGLWLRIFDARGILKSDPDVNSILMLRQLCCFFKKIEIQCSKNRVSNTVKEYYDVEDSLRQPTLLWADEEFDAFGSIRTVHFCDGLDDPISHGSNESWRSKGNHIELLCARLQRICDSIAGELGTYDPYEFTEPVGKSGTTKRYLSHGRGSVSDLGRRADKYVLPGWSERLQRVFPHDAFGCHRFDNTLEYHLWKSVSTSKLIAVPKTLSKPRLIASEPVAHQWCQQITLRWIVQRMRETRLGWFSDLSDQKTSQDMVLLQSTLRTGESLLATVDLSSASDRLTCWAIERFFRRNVSVLDALQSSRTPILVDGITLRDPIFLKKFASQGTAVTFPIQTLFFLACVLASLGCNSLRSAKKWKGLVRVFGDDIIIPKEGYENLRLLLSFLELKVNDEKSFVHGGFKESCGMDAYRGYDVTPVKPKTLVNRGPKSEQAMLDTSNNLWKKGFWHTSAWFETTYLRNKYPVVRPGLGVVGRTSFCGSKISHLKSRWNKNYHREEVLCRGFIAKTEIQPYDNASGIFQFFAENPSQDQKWSSGRLLEVRTLTRPQWVDVNAILVG